MFKKIVCGLVIFLVGVLTLLSNLDIWLIDFSWVSMWPSFFVFLGLADMLDTKKIGLINLLLVILGCYWVLYNTDVNNLLMTI